MRGRWKWHSISHLKGSTITSVRKRYSQITSILVFSHEQPHFFMNGCLYLKRWKPCTWYLIVLVDLQLPLCWRLSYHKRALFVFFHSNSAKASHKLKNIRIEKLEITPTTQKVLRGSTNLDKLWSQGRAKCAISKTLPCSLLKALLEVKAHPYHDGIPIFTFIQNRMPISIFPIRKSLFVKYAGNLNAPKIDATG